MQKKINNIGFTLVELVVVLIITATLATLALPRITFAIEKVRAKEGEQFLYTLLSAQKRYAIDNDNGDATPDYTIDIGALDVDFSRTPENFDDPTVSATSPCCRAALKMYHLATKPTVGGNPPSESRKIVSRVENAIANVLL